MRHILLLMILGLVVGCGETKTETPTTEPDPGPNPSASNPDNTDPKSTSDVLENGEAKRIRIQHCLITWKGAKGFKSQNKTTWKGPTVKRSKEQCAQLAEKIKSDCEGGWDFSKFVQMYSEDQINPADEIPGTYRLANTGVTAGPNETARGGMVKGFSDAAFSLKKVGDFAIAPYDETDSPYGWHVIKRIE